MISCQNKCTKKNKFFQVHAKKIIHLTTVVDIYLATLLHGKYPQLFTSTLVYSCLQFSCNCISWQKPLQRGINQMVYLINISLAPFHKLNFCHRWFQRLPPQGMHTAVSFQSPHPPYKDIRVHHQLSHENGSLKTKKETWHCVNMFYEGVIEVMIPLIQIYPDPFQMTIENQFKCQLA